MSAPLKICHDEVKAQSHPRQVSLVTPTSDHGATSYIYEPVRSYYVIWTYNRKTPRVLQTTNEKQPHQLWLLTPLLPLGSV